ncbi:hypothetical protein ABZ541_14175 [Micromonospora sediminicola]|uniref:hypothetical protein n=1 Tax=Micromonospora sediminicola TaxID=946078 RepID=UPI0033FF2BF1
MNDSMWRGWQLLLRSVDVRPADRDSLLMGRSVYSTEDGSLWWHPNDRWDAHLPAEAAHTLAKLASDAATAIGVAATLGDNFAVTELFTRAAKVKADEALDFADAKDLLDDLQAATSVSMVAVAVGGVVSTAVDAEGYATPILLGDCVLGGHLDHPYARAVDAHAHRFGLAGFRFSESWWTEDYLAAVNDPGVVESTQYEKDEPGDWPWMVFTLPVWGVPPACAAAATMAVQSILGVIVALDAEPRKLTMRAVPWIAGRGSDCEERRRRIPGDESILPPAVQYRGLRSTHLDLAENDRRIRFRISADIAALLDQPHAHALIHRIAAATSRNSTSTDKSLAAACRHLLLAAAAEDPDVRLRAASLGLDLLTSGTDAKLAWQSMSRWLSENAVTVWPDDEARFRLSGEEAMDTITRANRVLTAVDRGDLPPWSYAATKAGYEATILLQIGCVSRISYS